VAGLTVTAGIRLDQGLTARYLAKPVGGRQLVAVVATLARGGEAPARPG